MLYHRLCDYTFKYIRKCIEFVVLFYWLECTSQINETLSNFVFISQLNQFNDINNVNAVIQKN